VHFGKKLGDISLYNYCLKTVFIFFLFVLLENNLGNNILDIFADEGLVDLEYFLVDLVVDLQRQGIVFGNLRDKGRLREEDRRVRR
jgi:hypothetical protein